jgi:transcriptional regulator with XRE-family HTH domain
MKLNGHAVKAIRERTGLTPAELAESIGCSRRFVAYIEANDRDGSPKVIKAIAAALKVPITAIIKDVPERDAA